MDYLNYYQGKSILITGGLGFIGSNLARRLVDLGAHVTLVDSMIPDYGGNLFNIAGYEDRLRVNIADVRDPYSMRALVRGQHILFNLAGQVSHVDSMHDPFTDLEINARSPLSISHLCGNAATIWQATLPAPRRGAFAEPNRCQWSQQAGRRVVSYGLFQCLWSAHILVALD
jgi:UDP-glucose 4-epimerase